MNPCRIIITGAVGRMGRMLVSAITAHDNTTLVAASERAESAFIGRDAGELAGVETLNIPLYSDLSDASEADVLIDFTAPDACLAHARFVADHGMRMVIGTTGFTDAQLHELNTILAQTPAVMAANYSIGINLALQLIKETATVLDAEYDAEITETHHRHKVDAPSGTALAMGRAVAEGRGVKLNQTAVYAREGFTGARKAGDIGFSVVRAGGIVGEHTVMFASEEERLEIRHVAADRMAFARGAVRAAIWVMGQKTAGLYDMSHVLGLNA